MAVKGVPIRIDPTGTNQQASVMPFATPRSDGSMSKEQAAKVAGLIPGGGSSYVIRYVVGPGNTGIFFVDLPVPITVDYSVTMTVASANAGAASYEIPEDNQSDTSFMVITAPFPEGTILKFGVLAAAVQ